MSTQDKTRTSTIIHTNNNLWNKRLNWVIQKDSTKNVYQRLLLDLKIAYYDYYFAKVFRYESGKKKARAKISSINHRLRKRKLADEIKAVETLYKNEKRQIEYDKKLGHTFSTEVRNGKNYLYKQKRIRETREHTYIAKNWDDLNIKQSLHAQQQVFDNNWALKDLSHSEIKVFDLISSEIPKIESHKALSKDELSEISMIDEYIKQRNMNGLPASQYILFRDVIVPDPILEKAVTKLGMKQYSYHSKNHAYIITKIKPLPPNEVKKILGATKKALIRRANLDKAIEAMALTMSEGDSNPENLNKFIWHVVKESGALVHKDPIKIIENYVNERVLRNPNSMYSILKPMEVKTFSHRIIDRFKVINNQHFLK